MEVEGGRDSVSDIRCTIDKRVFKRVSHTENSGRRTTGFVQRRAPKEREETASIRVMRQEL